MASSDEKAIRGKHAAHAKPAQQAQGQVPEALQQRNPYEGIHEAPLVNPDSANVRQVAYDPMQDGQTQVLPAARGTQASSRTSQRGATVRPVSVGNSRTQSSAHRRSATGSSGNAGSSPVRTIDVRPMRPKKRHRALKVILGIVAVLVIAAVGFGLWFSHALDDTLERASRDEIAGDVLEPTAAGKAFYVLVLGSDSREGSGTSEEEAESGDNERSDVMILVRVDPDRRLLTMVSIPRDTPYRLSDGQLVKINEAYNIGGAAQSVEAVNELTGVRISHYVTVHFSELQQIVDTLGGVTVNVPIELSYQDALTGEWVTIEPGERTLTGQQAQIFARARHEYGTEQDANRQNAVRTLAVAILKTALNRPVTEIPGTIIDLAQYVGTDMRWNDLASLATSFGVSLGDMKVYSGTGPTDGDINPAAGDMWMCYYNPEGWKQLMSVVDAGGDPAGMTFASTAIPW